MEYSEVPIPLLPPSCFEVPKGTESLKSIAELTKEMLRLKDENIQLRYSVTNFSMHRLILTTSTSKLWNGVCIIF